MSNITTAVALKKELDDLRPISKADELRIMQKFRLDWNFHSNNLEGNSLTYGETKVLILFGLTAQGKPFRDSLEMRGHDEAVKWIEEIIKEERPLTENFIRQLNQIILKEDYQVDAITPDGKPTRKWVRNGKYKTEPNHVLTKTGEIFRFASPEETPAKMHDLVEWYREKKEKTNPILLAAEFHYRFIRIHPFDDGNGRTARILMNFILMQFGYSPVIIKTQDKENYIAALRQANAGILEPFIEYIAESLVHSLEIMIKGAKGENIEESDDLDKEISLLETKFSGLSADRYVKKNSDSILIFYDTQIIPLFRKVINDLRVFNKYYLDTFFTIWVEDSGDEYHSESDVEQLYYETREQLNEKVSRLSLVYQYEKLDRVEQIEFEHCSYIDIDLGKIYAKLSDSTGKVTIEKRYNENITKREMDELIRSEKRRHKDAIEQKIAELQKNRT
ncbi:MAG: Fic family protein [Bacteroidota bacterium]